MSKYLMSLKNKILDELEHLVVMQLFKLSKLLMSGTGYKLCCSESNHMIQHSSSHPEPPPHASVSWKEITNYTFLGEFYLLCHSCTHIQDCQWSEPAICEATAKYFKVCHAQEEITQLNVEIHHLWTTIHDEEKETSRAITTYLESELLLGQGIQHKVVNAVHLHHLDQIETLTYYTGHRGIGVHLECGPAAEPSSKNLSNGDLAEGEESLVTMEACIDIYPYQLLSWQS
ncbi:hypothetical protein PAXRUDRAFT_35990 [Paxillus rubicundulus Ve08.2h10]|uniref:Uncharacterized protein n=1 Tax=Paxillus rubicundulus Ve08.2h10 TaxID=930991 RepID=A0A0D0CZH1_9AGAM|nr:hypothetical protein PAXRUDRAFT_35990 [Paxillus rubicundulus Ve08.2h10]